MKHAIQNFVNDIHNDDYYKEYLTPEYTAEDMICDAGRKTEKLDGLWNFSTDQYDYCLRGKWFEEQRYDTAGRSLPVDYDFDGWGKIQVPGVWNTQKKEYFYYEGPGIYTKTFQYRNHGEKKVILKCGAVYYNARIFLNRKFVGFHKGGSTPFYIDITRCLQTENRIIIIADNTRDHTHIPSVNTDWFNYGGISRSVELIRLPELYISDFSIVLKKGSIDTAEGYITAVCPAEEEQHRIEAHICIKELAISFSVKLTKTQDGKLSGSFSFTAPFILWSPENPKLYEVEISAGQDYIRDQIGFRNIEVHGQRIYLNGKAIYLNGVSAHEESVANGRAVTEEEICENFTIAKEMGCNFMRLAHYPHTELAAKLADRMGIMLWEEIPVYWLIDFANAETYKDAENQLEELIRRDKNRASVVIWSVGNENPDTDERLSFMSRLAVHAKKCDPSRPVSAACLVDTEHLEIADRLVQFLDIIGLNEYYGWYDPDFEKLPRLLRNSHPEKPVIITEFGADAQSNTFGTIDEKGTENCQEYIYKRQTELFSQTPYIQGTTPWILFDFRTPRRMGAWQQGRNTKGLLSADKKHRKLAFYIMKEFYRNRGTTPEK